MLYVGILVIVCVWDVPASFPDRLENNFTVNINI